MLYPPRILSLKFSHLFLQNIEILYLVKFIKLITVDSTLSRFWSYLQNGPNDDQKQLPAPILTFCCRYKCKKIYFSTIISSILVYINSLHKYYSLSIFGKIFNSIISSWSRWTCCLTDPIPQAPVQTHMQVLIVPSSMYAAKHI